jgi:hypothetical protein
MLSIHLSHRSKYAQNEPKTAMTSKLGPVWTMEENPTVAIKTNPGFIARVLIADVIYTLALSALTGYY